jgi:hypothetical protein
MVCLMLWKLDFNKLDSYIYEFKAIIKNSINQDKSTSTQFLLAYKGKKIQLHALKTLITSIDIRITNAFLLNFINFNAVYPF